MLKELLTARSHTKDLNRTSDTFEVSGGIVTFLGGNKVFIF